VRRTIQGSCAYDPASGNLALMVAAYATEYPVASDAELTDQVPLIDAPDDNAPGRYRSRASGPADRRCLAGRE
jgi:hypothetical protein